MLKGFCCKWRVSQVCSGHLCLQNCTHGAWRGTLRTFLQRYKNCHQLLHPKMHFNNPESKICLAGNPSWYVIKWRVTIFTNGEMTMGIITIFISNTGWFISRWDNWLPLTDRRSLKVCRVIRTVHRLANGIHYHEHALEQTHQHLHNVTADTM